MQIAERSFQGEFTQLSEDIKGFSFMDESENKLQKLDLQLDANATQDITVAYTNSKVPYPVSSAKIVITADGRPFALPLIAVNGVPNVTLLGPLENDKETEFRLRNDGDAAARIRFGD